MSDGEFKPSVERHFRLFLITSVSLYSVGIFWGLPSEFDCAVDSPVPYSPLAFLAELRNPDTANKYPAFHNLLLVVPYGLVLALTKLTGNLGRISSVYPYGFRDPVTAFSWLIVTARMVSVLMTVGVLICIRRMTAAAGARRMSWLALGLFGASGVTTYYARVGNFDMPFVFWFSLSLRDLFLYSSGPPSGPARPLRAVAFAALAVATKDQAAGLAVGVLLTVCLISRSEADKPWVSRFRLTAVCAVVMGLVYAAAAVLPQTERWYHHVQIWQLNKPAVRLFVEFDNSASGHLRLLARTIGCASHILSPVGLLLAGVGAVALARGGRGREFAALTLPVLTYYATIIAPIRFVYDRFLLPAAVPATVLAAIGFRHLLVHARRGGLASSGKTSVLRWLVGATLIYQFATGYLAVTSLQIMDQKVALARSIGRFVPARAAILWVGGVTGLPNSDIYMRYMLISSIPSGGWDRAVRHAFSDDQADPEYLLASDPLPEASGDGELRTSQRRAVITARWVYPRWLKACVTVTCIKEYYLYKFTCLQ